MQINDALGSSRIFLVKPAHSENILHKDFSSFWLGLRKIESVSGFFFFLVAKKMLVPYAEGDLLSSNLAFNCRHQIVIEIKALDLPRLGTARAACCSTGDTFWSPPICFLPQVNPQCHAGVSLVGLWEALLPGG